MTTIKTTLDSALPAVAASMYPTEYAAVLEALVNRDYDLTDRITDVVTREFGVSRLVVREQLALAGMAVRPAPEPVHTPDTFMADFEAAIAAPSATAHASAPSGSDATKPGKKGGKKSLESRVRKLEKLAKRARALL